MEEDYGDIMCEVYEDGDFEEPKNEYGADHRYCNIKFNVTFTFVPTNKESELLDDVYVAKEEHTQLVGLDELTKPDEDSSTVLGDVLESINVPLSQIIIGKIKDCARTMVSDEKYKERRVLGMVVDLDVPREAPAPPPSHKEMAVEE